MIREAVVIRLLVPLGILVACIASCGGSGSGTMMQAAPILSFTPAAGPAPATVTMVRAGGSTDDLAVIELQVTDVTGLLAASFTLTYDPTVVGFVDFDSTGSFLGNDGASVQPIVQETQPGSLTVGLTRLATTGIDFTGTRQLIRIRFMRQGSTGSTALNVANEELLDAMTPPQPIASLQWFGGTFLIQ